MEDSLWKYANLTILPFFQIRLILFLIPDAHTPEPRGLRCGDICCPILDSTMDGEMKTPSASYKDAD